MSDAREENVAKCRHDNIRGIYGDEINTANARSECLDCRTLFKTYGPTRPEVDALRTRVEALTRDRDAEGVKLSGWLLKAAQERDAATARAERAGDALRKVLIHTAHLPAAPRELLVGLLASCARNAKDGLAALLAIGDAGGGV